MRLPQAIPGSHKIKAGMDYSRSAFDGRETFLPVALVGSSDQVIERITFTQPSLFSVHQNKATFYVSDEWSPVQRVTFTLGFVPTPTALPTVHMLRPAVE